MDFEDKEKFHLLSVFCQGDRQEGIKYQSNRVEALPR
jgi:hypothetical protein